MELDDELAVKEEDLRGKADDKEASINLRNEPTEYPSPWSTKVNQKKAKSLNFITRIDVSIESVYITWYCAALTRHKIFVKNNRFRLMARARISNTFRCYFRAGFTSMFTLATLCRNCVSWNLQGLGSARNNNKAIARLIMLRLPRRNWLNNSGKAVFVVQVLTIGFTSQTHLLPQDKQDPLFLILRKSTTSTWLFTFAVHAP